MTADSPDRVLERCLQRFAELERADATQLIRDLATILQTPDTDPAWGAVVSRAGYTSAAQARETVLGILVAAARRRLKLDPLPAEMERALAPPARIALELIRRPAALQSSASSCRSCGRREPAELIRGGGGAVCVTCLGVAPVLLSAPSSCLMCGRLLRVGDPVVAGVACGACAAEGLETWATRRR